MTQMQVAFYRGRVRFYNRAVSWLLYGPHSHVELVLDEDDGLLKCGSSSFMDDGVRVKWMKLNPAHWILLDVDEDYVFAEKWFKDHRGEEHELLGIMGAVWRRLTGEVPRWTSSHAVAAALGYPEPWRFNPMNLWATLSKTKYEARR